MEDIFFGNMSANLVDANLSRVGVPRDNLVPVEIWSLYLSGKPSPESHQACTRFLRTISHIIIGLQDYREGYDAFHNVKDLLTIQKCLLSFIVSY